MKDDQVESSIANTEHSSEQIYRVPVLDDAIGKYAWAIMESSGRKLTEREADSFGAGWLAAGQSRKETQREVLKVLTDMIQQVGAEQAAHVTAGLLQTQLGMTKPIAEVRAALNATANKRDNTDGPE